MPFSKKRASLNTPGDGKIPVETSPFRRLFSDHLPLQTETAFFILVNVLDIFLTYMLLRFGAIEANPLANYVLVRWGFVGMIAFKLSIVAMVCVIAQVIAISRPLTAKFLLWVGSLIVAAVVVYSMLLFWTNFKGAVPEI